MKPTRSAATLALPRLWCALLLGILAVSPATAAERQESIELQIQLVWGTNGDKPAEPKDLKEVDAETAKSLSTIFRWKNYFEVIRRKITVNTTGSQRLKLSEKCEVEIQYLGDAMIEARVFGEGKYFTKSRQSVARSPMTIGGEDKNATAWFVVIKKP